MSLHTLANHLQAAGRGDDKMLVHMTPGEVHGLQSLAMAHGGSLTINPQTGLPEAGFLSSLIPMIAGFALGPAGIGLTTMQAGLASAALGTVLTGDLKKGLMAGLGAYGGAGLGEGLLAQGAQAATAPNAVQTAATNMADDAANFAAKGSNPFSTNPMFNNSPAATSGGMTGFKNALPEVTPSATSSVFSGGINTPPAAIQGAMPTMAPAGATVNPVELSKAEMYGGRGVFNQGVPAPTEGPLTTVRAPTELYGETVNTYQTRLPQAAPYNGVYKTYGVGDMSDAVAVKPPFSGAMQGQYSGPSNAVEMSSQGVSRPFSDRMSQLGRGVENSSSMEGLKGLYKAMPFGSVAATGLSLADAAKPDPLKEKKNKSLIRPYEFAYNPTGAASEPYSGSAERLYFNPVFTAQTPYSAPGPEYRAAGGLTSLAVGGPVEQMAAMNSVGANTGYPMANLQTPLYANPMIQRPEATNVIAPSADAGVGAYSGEARFAMGGVSHLGDYSDGGRLLKGPGDGVSDSIPASINNRQPARLADGEFVVPARIVSEIGNGSTEAGARKLYAMMDRVQNARRKTVGKKQVAKDTQAEKLLPA